MSALKQFSIKLFLLLFTTSIAAQDIKNFDLRSYRLPDIRLHKLEFDTRLQGESNLMSYNRHFASTHLSQEVIDTTNDYASRFDGHLSANYHYYRNSRRLQLQYNTSVTYSPR